jgi:hypothetical protein
MLVEREPFETTAGEKSSSGDYMPCISAQVVLFSVVEVSKDPQ